MPLSGDVGANIRELETHGSKPRGHKQIMAIALAAARKGKKPGKKVTNKSGEVDFTSLVARK